MTYILNRALLAAIALSPCAALAQSAASISIEQPWSRATPGGATTAAAYLTIKNNSEGEDRLVAATSPAASLVQVHEMSMTGGVMKMQEVKGGLVVPAHGSVTLAPGGYHVMMIGVKHPLKAGGSFALALKFEKGGEVDVTVPIRPIGAAGPAASARAKADETGGMGGMKMP